MSDEERADIRARLIAAQFPERDIEWMVESCPNRLAAILLCKQQNKWWRA